MAADDWLQTRRGNQQPWIIRQDSRWKCAVTSYVNKTNRNNVKKLQDGIYWREQGLNSNLLPGHLSTLPNQEILVVKVLCFVNIEPSVSFHVIRIILSFIVHIYSKSNFVYYHFSQHVV